MVSPAAAEEEFSPGIEWPEPSIVTPGTQNAAPPEDAIVLFDGTDLSAWNHANSWAVADGIATVGDKSIETKQAFGDCQVHVEWSIPADVGTSGGQSRGNSGVYFMPHYNRVTDQNAKYEVQILDSFDYSTYPDGQAGAIYKQTPPMSNAMRPPGEWNAYDLVFTAPRYDNNGDLESPAYLTAFHNGVLIHNHVEIKGATSWDKPPKYSQHAAKLPIGLQAHWNRVHFRNIWAREFQPVVGKRVAAQSYYDRDTRNSRPAEDAASPTE